MKETLFSLGCFFLLVAPSAIGSRPIESQSAALVDPDWLANRLGQPDVRIFELGQRELYERGHLPQAVFVDWIEDITDSALPDQYNILPRQQMEELLSRLGVSKNTTVVLYDKLASRLATRMFWSLRFYGHQQVKILDGGELAWYNAGHKLVTEVPVFEKSNYRVGQVNSSLEADRKFIKARLGQPKVVLIDGRPTDQYTGQLPGKVYHTGKEHTRRGHLPQAVNIPWRENLTSDGRFKSVNELRKLYNAHEVAKDATIITYCNEGLHAAHPWFVLTELLGYRDVRLYDDSLSEWANTADEPLVLGNGK